MVDIMNDAIAYFITNQNQVSDITCVIDSVVVESFRQYSLIIRPVNV